MRKINNIILIGMPLSGKSTVGKIISENLNYAFIDTDELIEKKEGQSISKIFKDKGELHFRNIEKSLIGELKGRSNTIISTGGGMPIFFDNMEKLKDIGVTVFLNVPLYILKDRSEEFNNRPLLRTDNENALEKMYNLRECTYKRADIIVEVKDMKAQDVASYIINKISGLKK